MPGDDDRDEFDWPNGYPDGHFFGDDLWIDDSFDSIMEKWKSLGPDKFADENQELGFKPSLESSNDYTNYWNGVLEVLRRLESIPGAVEQLAKMVWHGLFSGNVEKGITDIGKPGVSEGLNEVEPNKLADDKVTKGLQQLATIGVKLQDLPAFTKDGTNMAKVAQSDRIYVVVNIGGVNVPYYISTGEGGKASVPTGKWYPFFGLGPSGWLNKGSEQSINKFYGSARLKTYANLLNLRLGDLQGEPLPAMTKTARDVINKDMLNPQNHFNTNEEAEIFKKRINTILQKIGDVPFYATQQPGVSEGIETKIRAKNQAVVKKLQGKEVKEDITQEDIITKLKAKLGDYLSDLGQQIKKDPALQDKLADKPKDTMGPAVKTVTTDDGQTISIHGNEDDGFRISIKNKPATAKFKTVDEAALACNMFNARRKNPRINTDYVDEA